MDKKLLLRALKKYKSQANLARALNVSRQFINQLVKGHRPIPDDILDNIKGLF